jgi:hypothetical protein
LPVEPSPEPRTSKEEEIPPSKFSSPFEDDPLENLQNTSKHLCRKEPSSIHISRSRNPLTESSLRLTVPLSPPDPPNEAFLKKT